MARDEFPRQVGLGSGAAVGWVESEIDNYLAERVRHRDIAWQRLGDVASRVAEKVKSTE
jgi:Prophage CP4-57 regulatory protein (AlpA)